MELKAYKSLDGYKNLLAGWVGSVHAYAALDDGSKIIVTAYVQHSQSETKTKFRPCFAAESTGTIIYAHCTWLDWERLFAYFCPTVHGRNSHSLSKEHYLYFITLWLASTYHIYRKAHMYKPICDITPKLKGKKSKVYQDSSAPDAAQESSASNLPQPPTYPCKMKLELFMKN